MRCQKIDDLKRKIRIPLERIYCALNPPGSPTGDCVSDGLEPLQQLPPPPFIIFTAINKERGPSQEAASISLHPWKIALIRRLRRLSLPPIGGFDLHGLGLRLELGVRLGHPAAFLASSMAASLASCCTEQLLQLPLQRLYAFSAAFSSRIPPYAGGTKRRCCCCCCLLRLDTHYFLGAPARAQYFQVIACYVRRIHVQRRCCCCCGSRETSASTRATSSAPQRELSFRVIACYVRRIHVQRRCCCGSRGPRLDTRYFSAPRQELCFRHCVPYAAFKSKDDDDNDDDDTAAEAAALKEVK